MYVLKELLIPGVSAPHSQKKAKLGRTYLGVRKDGAFDLILRYPSEYRRRGIKKIRKSSQPKRIYNDRWMAEQSADLIYAMTDREFVPVEISDQEAAAILSSFDR